MNGKYRSICRRRALLNRIAAELIRYHRDQQGTGALSHEPDGQLRTLLAKSEQLQETLVLCEKLFPDCRLWKYVCFHGSYRTRQKTIVR
jgi:hypothetical protein